MSSVPQSDELIEGLKQPHLTLSGSRNAAVHKFLVSARCPWPRPFGGLVEDPHGGQGRGRAALGGPNTSAPKDQLLLLPRTRHR